MWKLSVSAMSKIRHAMKLGYIIKKNRNLNKFRIMRVLFEIEISLSS